jgi:hypothetical protein
MSPPFQWPIDQGSLETAISWKSRETLSLSVAAAAAVCSTRAAFCCVVASRFRIEPACRWAQRLPANCLVIGPAPAELEFDQNVHTT